jgi:mannosidase alpha-like ER degradation enhancer 1
MTMLDSLSTLAVLGETKEFIRAVDWVTNNVDFDQDVRVNLFEANIRLLGGLLSAHVLASDKNLGLHPNYNGSLLRLATDLGNRFMPAFVNVRPHEDEYHDDEDEDGNHHSSHKHTHHSSTSKPKVQLPYAWINLRSGVIPGETTEQCVAGIGTLLLEFGLLSFLTNDTRFYDVAERSLFALWGRRDPQTNLLGNSLSCTTGEWTNANAGVGAGVDSFYEVRSTSGRRLWAGM